MPLLDPTQTPERKQPAPGQIWQRLDDGRMAFWFDSHTLQDFTKCETYFNLKNLEYAPLQLRRKGAPAACISIGSWWSRVSELFYKQVAKWHSQHDWETGYNAGCTEDGKVIQKPDMMDMLAIAAKAWVREGMDNLQKADPVKYDKFAIPVTYGEFGKYFRDGSAVEDMFMIAYKRRIHELRNKAQVAVERHDFDHYMEQAREMEARTALPLGALLMAAQYYDTFAEHDMRNWRVIAAEAHFGSSGEVPIGETDKVVVYWQGRPDLVVYEPSTNVLAPLDQKTKEYIPYNVQQIWKPHNQMAGYIYSIRHIANSLGYSNAVVDRCILSVCGRLQPAQPRKKGDSPKPRFVRVQPTFSIHELDEWRLGILNKAERLRYSLEKNVFTRNEFACHIWSGCEYRGICSRPPGVRDLIIQSDYIKVEPWSPFDEDGD